MILMYSMMHQKHTKPFFVYFCLLGLHFGLCLRIYSEELCFLCLTGYLSNFFLGRLRD